MNATNRFANRVVLLLGGAALLIAGVVIVLWSVRPPWAAAATAQATGTVEDLLRTLPVWDAPFGGTVRIPAAGVIVGGGAVVLIVLLIVFLTTRGAGRSATAVADRTPLGRTEVDRRVADRVLAAPLAERADVLDAHGRVHRVRGGAAYRLAVRVRRGADLAEVVGAAERAAQEWDALASRPMPVLLHLADRSWTDRWRSTVRVR
ncbi:hypothetical protein G3H63_11910 [Microbacterium resistens]|uniref:hypothetical protein n=1 Tax=Microbacterium resistens TaxID=156977 RepID=UPI001C58C229|nr:hypothetical protein [Microbacterium resistens]MBW1639769.1 hypothetical protein [Microbacterium resistens]